MPGLTRIYKEIAKNKEFSNQIQECRRIGAQSYIEQAMEELEHADNRNIMIVREKSNLLNGCAANSFQFMEINKRSNKKLKEIAWNNNKDNVVDVTPDEVGITDLAKT